jgi:hypothetical protein
VTLVPVPAVGGSLLAIVPLDPERNCSCTPEETNVIATTTALAFTRNQPNIADVCMVRLLIDNDVFADVNLDNIVDGLDVHMVENSTYFSLSPLAPSKCDFATGCGREDVNKDGKVDQLDSTSITQSAILGTNVTCGGIYATAFSCGSTRKAPLTPAVSISLDTISYFSDDGLIVEGKLLQHQYTDLKKRSMFVEDTSLVQDILVKMEEQEQDLRLFKIESEKRDELQDQRFEKQEQTHKSYNSNLFSDVLLSVLVVLVCGIALVIVRKKF